MIKVRTRYAPSPTGVFHIGGARTALFNYLFAKNQKGDFIVRIEDTDIERNVEGGIKSQLDNLEWCNITPDESVLNPKNYAPYVQTQKLERYEELANLLLKENKAYYCFCSKEQLDSQRTQALKNGQTPKYNRACFNLTQSEIDEKLKSNIPHVIRLKINDNVNIEWDDLVRGHMSVPTSALTDPVILKSNHYPMYNFAVVIDDYDMDITHILRGEEHISNTPYQIAIKEALGFDSKLVKYGHLSIIVDKDGKKLSKRDASLKQFIEDYKDLGYIPQAVVNFLGLLGWSPTTNTEILSLEEMIENFKIERVSKSPAFFDIKKMQWISSEYFKKMSREEYLKFVKPFVTIDLNLFANKLDELLLIFKNQISYAQQINDLINENFMQFDLTILPTDVMDFMKTSPAIKTLFSFRDLIRSKNINDENQATEFIESIKKNSENSGKSLFMPIRIAMTSKTHGPELAKILNCLPKETIISNLDYLINFLGF